MLRDLFPRTHDHYEGSRFAGDLEAFAKWLWGSATRGHPRTGTCIG